MPKPLSKEWIEEQLGLCEKQITEGPYKIWCSDATGRTWLNGIGGKPIALFTDDTLIGPMQEAAGIGFVECAANAVCIAAAFEGYPVVLKELQRLRRVVWDAHRDLMQGEAGHAGKTLDADREPGTESYYD